MKILRNEKGIALILVLMLSVIALAIMSALIYMVTSGTQTSGMQKRYKTAIEAGVGGADITYQLISTRGTFNIADIGTFTNFTIVTPVICLTAKLNTTTSAANWGACTDFAQTSSITIDPNDIDTYDMRFDLGINPTYRAYAKIADTVEGNSGGDEGLVKGSVVSVSGSGEVTVQSRPYLYTIEINAQNPNNPDERAKLSVLYQY